MIVASVQASNKKWCTSFCKLLQCVSPWSDSVVYIHTHYADAKLKRNDKVISIGAGNNSAIVRGHQVDIDTISLFIRVTCMIRNRADMKDHLKHEFSKHPPSLFENGMMRKNTKSAFANVLKAHVDPLSIDNLQNLLHVIDGGHMLYSVTWPSVCTYQDVIDNYVAYVLNNYGPETRVCFDGYSNLPMSTKVADQCRRTTDQNVSLDILFELDMLVTSSQHIFLGNRQNKSRFSTTLMKL